MWLNCLNKKNNNSVAEQAGLNVSWLKISKDTFSRDVAQLFE